MGSKSDWETLRHADELLTLLEVPHECRIVSAHRTPLWLAEYAAQAEARGLEVIIAGAGGAAHLPGMAAAQTVLPVLGVPVESQVLKGVDSCSRLFRCLRECLSVRSRSAKPGPPMLPCWPWPFSSNSRPQLREKLKQYRQEPNRPSHDRAVALSQHFRQILPGSAIGVLGSGQLGRMFAIAARRMGYRVHTLSPESDTPTGQVADVEITASYQDLDAVRKFARGVSAVTFEFENVPAITAQAAAEFAPVRPDGMVLHTTQNRLREKSFLRVSWTSGHSL